MNILEMRFMDLNVLYTSPSYSPEFSGVNEDRKGVGGGGSGRQGGVVWRAVFELCGRS